MIVFGAIIAVGMITIVAMFTVASRDHVPPCRDVLIIELSKADYRLRQDQASTDAVKSPARPVWR